jgi:hypothetical protein
MCSCDMEGYSHFSLLELSIQSLVREGGNSALCEKIASIPNNLKVSYPWGPYRASAVYQTMNSEVDCDGRRCMLRYNVTTQVVNIAKVGFNLRGLYGLGGRLLTGTFSHTTLWGQVGKSCS